MAYPWRKAHEGISVRATFWTSQLLFGSSNIEAEAFELQKLPGKPAKPLAEPIDRYIFAFVSALLYQFIPENNLPRI
jgi:hypothetical protein